jgi:uncharacterized repeat protein (TIGR03803 family)
MLASAAWASEEKVLWNFSGTNGDGSNPWSNYFISDAKGNLYGATASGGTYSNGMVFMLTPAGEEKILYEFQGQGAGDGSAPHGRLAFDAKGNIYGTTQAGGTNGTGTVYELTKHGSAWKEQVLYTFSSGGLDGTSPSAGMTIAADGTMYSTTPDGGAYSAGAIFSLKKTGKGWQQTVIHSLDFSAGEGGFPYEGLMMDAAGNLYGGAPSGGSGGAGVIYRLSPTKQGWQYTNIYNFTGQNGDGSQLYWIDLISDPAGNIYGATSFGGTNGTGTVWELVYSKAKKTYSESILYEFGTSGDGNNPYGGLARDSKGNLYGTTLNGGSDGLGVVYKVTKHGKTWKETIVHNFAGGTTDGGKPTGNLFMDSTGRVYGMAENGGTSNLGIVYRMTP